MMINTDCCSASRQESVYGLSREPGVREIDLARCHLEHPSKLDAARIIDQRDQTKLIVGWGALTVDDSYLSIITPWSPLVRPNRRKTVVSA